MGLNGDRPIAVRVFCPQRSCRRVLMRVWIVSLSPLRAGVDWADGAERSFNGAPASLIEVSGDDLTGSFLLPTCGHTGYVAVRGHGRREVEWAHLRLAIESYLTRGKTSAWSPRLPPSVVVN